MSALISIFMPVYNGAQYLNKSIYSIINQTFTSFELVCVDDSSTDYSFELLSRFAAIDSRIKVFKKENGGSVPKSWNFALPHLTGKYILYTSQDDFMSVDLLEKMYTKAVETNADATIPNLICYYGDEKNNITKLMPFDKSLILSGRDAFIYSLNWDIHAFVLWNAELVKQIGFDELATNSDEYATRNFFLNSKKVVFSEGTFYYGNTNPDAITKRLSIKRFDWIITNQRLLNLLYRNNFEEKVIKRFTHRHWGVTVYFHSQLLKHYSQFPRPERKRAIRILKDSYSNMDMTKTYKGFLARQLFSHGFFLIQITMLCYTFLVSTKTTISSGKF
jgi:glycosyltransferase involved in cell wall biosynthesis